MPDPARIMLVTDRRRCAIGLAELSREAAAAGLDDLQVREKDLPGRALLTLVCEILQAVRGTAVRVFVNGRPDVARAAGAHGVHLPELGLPVADVKQAFPSLLVGASRHSLEGASTAAADGADLVVLGPIFPTPGKEERTLGLATLHAVAEAVPVPVYAIGGIGPGNAAAVRAAGAAGIALLRPFLEPPASPTLAGLRAALS